MNNQQADITTDLTDERLAGAAADAFNKYLIKNPQIASYQACRAVAALARDGWQPIRSNAMPVAEGESQELSQQLHELVAVLESLQIPNWPGRVLRAAELLGQQQASTSMPAVQGDSEIEELARWVEVRAEKAKIPQYYMRFKRIAALLRQQQAPAPVLASKRPWKQEGWLHPQGLWCWQWRSDSVSWQMTTCGFSFAPSDDSLFLPHWAIIDPESTNTSS